MENQNSISQEFLDIEEIIIPEGISITIEEVESINQKGVVKVNKDNELVDGIAIYLQHVKRGERKIQVIRVNKLQKINIGLASAA